jgi:hypothetical protein
VAVVPLLILCNSLYAQGTFTVDTLTDEVFLRMQGKSFPAGCTVKRADLRYLTIQHYDFQGQAHTGELVCNRLIANDLVDIFRELYKAHYPIERMRLIDDYDADDERSMRDNNTSCFCFRVISGSQKLSNHALGLAIDINPLYNPYQRGNKVQPSNALKYCNRKCKFPYKITRGDLCYRLFKAHGFRWGGDWKSPKDYQHFEK